MKKESSLSGLTERIERLLTGELDPAAIESMFQIVHAEALGIARAQYRRRGSPDGVTGASDLANSQMGRIWADPKSELRNVATTDDLRHVLHRMLLDLWIERRRCGHAATRGSGNLVLASQLENSSGGGPELIELSPPSQDELRLDLEVIMEAFPATGHEQVILLLMMEGCTQSEIASRTGLSRHAVGRRVRQTIIPRISKVFCD